MSGARLSRGKPWWVSCGGARADGAGLRPRPFYFQAKLAILRDSADYYLGRFNKGLAVLVNCCAVSSDASSLLFSSYQGADYKGFLMNMSALTFLLLTIAPELSTTRT